MTGRDPVVARALAQLPVPDHAPDFWDRLGAELAAPRPPLRLPSGTATGTASGTATGADGASVATDAGSVVADVVALHGPTRRRPDRKGPLRGLAVAAVIAVVVGGIVQAAGDDGNGGNETIVPGGEVTTTLASDPATATTVVGTAPPTTSATTPPVASTDVQGAVDQAVAFVGSMAAEDVEAAATRVGPGTEQYVATMDGLEAYLASTTNSWGSYVDAELSTVVVDPGSVVVVFDAATGPLGVLPVVRSESTGAWFVEPLAYDAAVDARIDGVLSPDPEDAGVYGVDADHPLVISYDFPLQLALAGGAPVTAVPEDTADGGRGVTWAPDSGATGPGILVAARRSDDGPVFVAVAFRVDQG